MKTKSRLLTSSIIVVVLALVAAACGSGGNDSGSAAPVFSDIPTPSTLDINNLSAEDEALFNALVSYSEQLLDENSQILITIGNFPTAPRNELNDYARCQAEAVFQGIGGAEGARGYDLTPERVQDGAVYKWLELYGGLIDAGENEIELPVEIIENIFILFQRSCPEAYEFKKLLTISTSNSILAEALNLTDKNCTLESTTKLSFIEQFIVLDDDEAVETTEEVIQVLTESLEELGSCMEPREFAETKIISEFSWIKWDSCTAATLALEIYFDYRYVFIDRFFAVEQEIIRSGKIDKQALEAVVRIDEIGQVGTQLSERLLDISQACIDFEELGNKTGVEADQLIRQMEICLTSQTYRYLSVLALTATGLEGQLSRISDILTKDNCDGISEEITSVLQQEI